MTADALTRRQVERWFVRRGVPHFIVDYTASSDIFTRAAPLLAVVFLAENGYGVPFRFRIVGQRPGFSWGAGHRRRHHRRGQPAAPPAIVVAAGHGRPDRAGGISARTAADSVGHPRPVAKTVGTFVGNVVFLGVVYLATSYALLPILRWAFIQSARQLRTIANLMAKSLPLMLLFSMFIFVNADTWGLAGQIPTAFLAIAVVIVVAIGSLFILLRVPHELHNLGAFDTWAEVSESAAGSPAGELHPDPDKAIEPDGLRRRERTNLGLVLFFNQAVQVFLVTVAIGAFYLVFGIFVMQRGTVKLWTGHPAHVLGPTLHFLGGQVFLSRELVITAIFVAAVSGLQFAVAAVTDATYREEFQAGLTRELRTALAARLLYRAAYLQPDNVMSTQR